MNDKLRESLSALMDDEANELEIERVLKQAGADDELRQVWMRYHLARHAANGQPIAHLDLDISGRVQEALGEHRHHDTGQTVELKQRLLRPLASFAIAASVAATAVIGGQQLAQIDSADPYQQSSTATYSPPVGISNSIGAVPLQASFGLQPVPVLKPTTRTAYQDLARQRLNKYSQEHAEQAALNSPQGLISYARVPEIRQ